MNRVINAALMRVRVTIEYDTDETLAYERDAMYNGDVGFHDFMLLADDPSSGVVWTLEALPEPEVK